MSASGENKKLIDFLKLFLLTNKEQRLGLLRNIKRDQCELLRQVAYNILFNSSVKLSDRDRSYLKRRSGAIKRLASKKVCHWRKREILVKHHRLIKRVAEIALVPVMKKYVLIPYQRYKVEGNGDKVKGDPQRVEEDIKEGHTTSERSTSKITGFSPPLTKRSTPSNITDDTDKSVDDIDAIGPPSVLQDSRSIAGHTPKVEPIKLKAVARYTNPLPTSPIKKRRTALKADKKTKATTPLEREKQIFKPYHHPL